MGVFTNVRQYVYDRRRTLAVAAGVAGGVYLAGKYVLSRLEEMRESVAIERNARDSLRRRFGQNQSDVSFTVLALLPAVGHRILDAMNVERITLDLKSLGAPSSKSTSAPSAGSSLAPTPSPASVPLPPTPAAVTDDACSETSEASSSARDPLAESSTSWVDQFSRSQLEEGTPEKFNLVNLGDSVAAISAQSEGGSPKSIVLPTTSSLTSSMISEASSSSRAPSRTSEAPPLVVPRTKAELWRDLKILSFTRALTLAYTTTLLALLTTTQLSLLGRLKYVRAVHEAAHEQSSSDTRPQDAPSSIVTDFAAAFFRSGSSKPIDADEEKEPMLTEDEERKFLSLSWWLLHDGWRVISHRVRTAIESVFDGVSLKTELSLDDLIVLIRSARDNIDMSDNLSEALLPPEDRLLQILNLGDPTISPPAAYPAAHLSNLQAIRLAQLPDPSAPTSPLFFALLEEIQARIRSADFALVLRAAMTRAESSVLESIDAEVYAPQAAAQLDHEGTALESAFGPRVRELPDPRVKLAALLPAVARWAHTTVGSGYPNELVENLTHLREVEAFAAIVYGAYDDTLGR
ncbi:Peroxin-3 [Auriculariales sp. MPI-PUGE-AT-0066]|nr:Peroxin-3 [Auriculariales sp. MPI-PUGE-AT-0066]